MNCTDLHEVTDLLYLYSECVDTRRFDRLGEIFATDAEVDLGYGAWQSIDTIIAGYQRLLAPVAGTAHSLSNVRLQLDAGSGRSTAYVHAWHWMPREAGEAVDQPADFLFVALYRDDLVKLDDVGWRIRRRRARRVGPTALAAGAVPASMSPNGG